MHFPFSFKRCRDGIVALALALLGATAFAEGPVSIANLPGGGGNVVVDTDITEGSGLGQRWGRAGGRSITYHVASPATFSALTFSTTQAPSLQFDGFVTPTPSGAEIMTYSPADSQLGNGVAVWNGAATLSLATGTLANWPTRFTMTVTTASGTPIPLTIGPGGIPTASVLTTGDFKVNLLFSFRDLGNPSLYRPALDYYDSLATPPGNPPASNNGPVTTGVSTGFFYTLAVVGMTLEEHDAHVQALFDALNPKINNINDKINFIRQDWVRVQSADEGIGEVKTTLSNFVLPALNPLPGMNNTINQIAANVLLLLGNSGGTGNLATKNDVTNAVQPIMEMVMIQLGVMPCPVDKAPPGFCTNFGSLKKLGGDTTDILAKLDSAPTLDGILIGMNNALQGVARQSAVDQQIGALSAKVDELQLSVDNMASQSLDVRAVQIDSNDPKKLRWIVKVTRDGVMVNASITRFATVLGNSLVNALPGAVITTLAPGLYDVVLTIAKNQNDGAAYLFEAKIIGPSDIVGSALLVTEKKGASPF